MITKDNVKELFDYDQNTGNLIRRSTGRKADSPQSKGYLKVNYKGAIYASHRIVWLWNYGAWPEDDIDHINHVRTDNRIANLRDVPHIENMKSVKRDNKTGFEGVKFSGNKFTSHIKTNGKKLHLGTFDTAKEAHEAYVNKHIELYGLNSKFYLAM